MTSDQCPNCGHENPLPDSSERETNQPAVVDSITTTFANGMGAITATGRLASIARRENILVAVAIAIAFDYFSVLSHAASLAPVC